MVADSDVKNTSMIKWLEDIGSASHFITNSYHGMIMALLFHVPFVVLLETKESVGMNDRFSTLLSRIGLIDRISDNDTDSINTVLSRDIDWNAVDGAIEEYRKVGEDFLSI